MTNNNKEDLLVRLCKRQAVSDFISNENFSEVDYDKILKLEPDEDGLIGVTSHQNISR
jgi:hypothetical protein